MYRTGKLSFSFKHVFISSKVRLSTPTSTISDRRLLRTKSVAAKMRAQARWEVIRAFSTTGLTSRSSTRSRGKGFPVQRIHTGLASSSITRAPPMPASKYCQRPVVAVASANLVSRAAIASSRTPTRALNRILSAIKSLMSNIRK